MDCSLLGSSIHGIFKARILEWVAISFSRGSSWSRDQTQVSWVSCNGKRMDSLPLSYLGIPGIKYELYFTRAKYTDLIIGILHTRKLKLRENEWLCQDKGSEGEGNPHLLEVTRTPSAQNFMLRHECSWNNLKKTFGLSMFQVSLQPDIRNPGEGYSIMCPQAWLCPQLILRF